MLHRVKRNRNDDNKSFDQAGVCGRHRHQIQSVIQKAHKDSTEDSSRNRSFSAKQ